MARLTIGPLSLFLSALSMLGCQINVPNAQITANTNVNQNSSTVIDSQQTASPPAPSPSAPTKERTVLKGVVTGLDLVALSEAQVEIVSNDPGWQFSYTNQSRDGLFSVSDALVGAQVEVRVIKSGYKPKLASVVVSKDQFVRIELEPDGYTQPPDWLSKMVYERFDSPHFFFFYPQYWHHYESEGVSTDKISYKSIAHGYPDGRGEGIHLTSINDQYDADPKRANQLLADDVINDIRAGMKSFEQVSQVQTKLSGQPAFRLEAKITRHDGGQSYIVVYSAVYDGRSYSLNFEATPPEYIHTAKPLFSTIANGFEFKSTAISGGNPD